MVSSITPEIPDHVSLGENCELDSTVLLGYRTGRKNVVLESSIGDESCIRSGSVLYQGITVGRGLQTGHNVVIREENQIGDHFQIWNNTVIDYGCKIGSGVKIHANCYVAQFTEIGNGVFMAPGVTIANDPHPGCPQSAECMKGPVIEDSVQIGVNVTILPMVKIGARSLVGSGAVVTRDVPPDSVVFGNPARVRGSVYDLDCPVNLRDRPYDPPEE
ncbi:MAG: DapH/DapD/GlmU-related protein [Candidatus Krumholzibacteria bacterium]|nr:DapH/DapD/GlmU-related protein [Candidatus Krumholzibacteria bacterium]MDP6796358.1 DapH/DapD/GlmU-related protein [Candidatus Krumholzibacteria bacterium]